MSGEELNGLISRFLKKNGFVALGFLGLGGYEAYDNITSKKVESAIRHKYVDELIKMIHEDKAIEGIQNKNREQDSRIKAIEKDIDLIKNKEI